MTTSHTTTEETRQRELAEKITQRFCCTSCRRYKPLDQKTWHNKKPYCKSCKKLVRPAKAV